MLEVIGVSGGGGGVAAQGEAGGRRLVVLHLDRDSVPDSAVPMGVSREELLSKTYGLATVRKAEACTMH